MDSAQNPTGLNKSERLEQIAVPFKKTEVNRAYTSFVRWMRILLPLSALALIAIVFAWPDMEKKIEPVRKEEILPKAIKAQNELIKPRFESTDRKKQPFTVTAVTARQNEENPELVYLEKPVADMLLNNGARVSGKADKGIYEQQTEKLFLEGHVRLLHDSGYELEAEEMRIDMKTREAFSDKAVYVHGPAGTVKAVGLKALSQEELLVFNGPATLTLKAGQDGFELGKALP